MYAVFHSEKRKRILVTGPRINIGKVLEEEIPDNCNFECTPPDAPIFDDNRSRNLSRWRNKHRVEKMGKRRGRKCRK